MLRFFKLLVLRDLKDRYPNKLSFLTEFIALVGPLIVFWYSAEAFSPTFKTGFEQFGHPFFTFLVIGELTTALPAMIALAVSRAVRRTLLEGTLEHFILSGH